MLHMVPGSDVGEYLAGPDSSVTLVIMLVLNELIRTDAWDPDNGTFTGIDAETCAEAGYDLADVSALDFGAKSPTEIDAAAADELGVPGALDPDADLPVEGGRGRRGAGRGGSKSLTEPDAAADDGFAEQVHWTLMTKCQQRLGAESAGGSKGKRTTSTSRPRNWARARRTVGWQPRLAPRSTLLSPMPLPIRLAR